MNSLGRIIDINFNDLLNLYNHFKVKNMNNFFTECINVHIKKQDIVFIFKKINNRLQMETKLFSCRLLNA